MQSNDQKSFSHVYPIPAAETPRLGEKAIDIHADPTPNEMELGRRGYIAYGLRPSAHGPWTTFDGRPMPKYEDLKGESGEFTKVRWGIAARAIIADAPESQVDGPVFNLGRSEGRADVAVQLRKLVDPEDLNHWNLDGTLAEVARLVQAAPLLKELLAILSQHCGERGDSEGAVETLKRLVKESRASK